MTGPTALEPQILETPEAPEPKERRRSNLRRGLWLAGLALLALCGYRLLHRGAGAGQAPAAAAPARNVPVVVVKARQGDLPLYLDGLGSVTAFNTVSVKSRVDGTLESVAFREGQLVGAGDLLAQIDPRPFQVQLEQAEGQMARDQATLNNARLDLTRYQTLFQQDSVSRQQLDTQIGIVAQYEGTVKIDQALIDNARLQLTYCRIVAPIGGRIGLRLVDAGNIVHANDPNGLLVITQIRPIAVLFTLPEDQLPAVLKKLRSGERLTVDAYDRSGSTRLASGTLLTVDNEIDPTTGTSRLKAVFDNSDGALFPNQFVNVRLQIEMRRGAVIVPAAAIQRGPKGAFVYAVKADDTVEARPITVGPVEGNDATIDQGVAAGDTVVVDGLDKLRAGTSVRPETAPGGGGKPADAGGHTAEQEGNGGRKPAP